MDSKCFLIIGIFLFGRGLSGLLVKFSEIILSFFIEEIQIIILGKRKIWLVKKLFSKKWSLEFSKISKAKKKKNGQFEFIKSH